MLVTVSSIDTFFFVCVNLCQVDKITCLLTCKSCEHQAIVLGHERVAQQQGHGFSFIVFCCPSENFSIARIPNENLGVKKTWKLLLQFLICELLELHILFLLILECYYSESCAFRNTFNPL